jgi:Asp-tRNA(Asn)/Glu-tRNA(Gln) amidotransferase A subunit family amidase
MTKSVSTKRSMTNKPLPTLRLANAILPDLVDGLERGTITSEQLIKAHFARISEVNPEFHAVIETSSNVLDNARLLDISHDLHTPPAIPSTASPSF